VVRTSDSRLAIEGFIPGPVISEIGDRLWRVNYLVI